MSRYGDEQVQALEWAYAACTGSQALADAVGVTLANLPAQVWEGAAPAEATGTLVILSASDPRDLNGVGDVDRLMAAVPLTVRATQQARSYDGLAPVARALYTLLHGVTNAPVANGGVILTCRREAGIQYPETVEGVQYRHLGHQFRVEIN